MRITLVGANHRSAPVELREKLAFRDEDSLERLQTWMRQGTVGEALILSTCNRVEIITVTPDANATESILDLLSNVSSVSKGELSNYIYKYTDDDAVKHLYR